MLFTLLSSLNPVFTLKYINIIFSFDLMIIILHFDEETKVIKKILLTLTILILLTACIETTPKRPAYTDNVEASVNPPGGLTPEQVPQFVVFGFDDNNYSGMEGSGGTGGVSWVLDYFGSKTNPEGNGNTQTFDGTSLKASFYATTSYISSSSSEANNFVKISWNRAYTEGFEIASHTHSHPHGARVNWNVWPAEWNVLMDTEDWYKQVTKSLEWLSKPFSPDVEKGDSEFGAGVPLDEIIGFRTPFLEQNDDTITALQQLGLLYDCTIEEGWQAGQDGSNFFWPYTLNNGSPVADATYDDWYVGRGTITSHPGFWEIPCYTVFVPTDEECEQYGIEPGFRQRLNDKLDYFDVAAGNISGLDWNLWIEFGMTKDEFVAVLKYNLDIRLAGNKAPFTIGMHSDIYSSKYEGSNLEGEKIYADLKERQEAVEEFIEYALTKHDVRLVSAKQMLDWLRDPSAL